MRLVSVADHPANLSVFVATSMAEALVQADKAFRTDGLQGAVWQAPQSPIDWNSEDNLGHAFKKAVDFKGKGSYTVVMNMVTTEANKKIIGFGHDHLKKMSPAVLDQPRRDNLDALTNVFDGTQLSVRYERERKANPPHYDGDAIDFHADYTRPFMGQNIRILCARQGLGTIVFDPAAAGEEALQPWHVDTGSYLFLTGRNGIEGKALLHATPAFPLVDGDNNRRVVDVYDCYCR